MDKEKSPRALVRRELARKVAAHVGLAASEVERILQQAEKEMAAAMGAGRKVLLQGFLSFQPYVSPERPGRNPQDPEKLFRIPKKGRVRLRLGTQLTAALRQLPQNDAARCE